MTNTYYVVNDRKYLDRHLIRENFNLTKSALQYLLSRYEIDESEIENLQNKKLYSIEAVYSLVENILYDHANG